MKPDLARCLIEWLEASLDSSSVYVMVITKTALFFSPQHNREHYE